MAAAALMLLLGPAPAPTDAFQGRIRAPSLRRPMETPRWRTVGTVRIRDDGVERRSEARRWASRPGPQEGEGGAGGRRKPRGGASVDGDDEDEGDHDEQGRGGKVAGRIGEGGGEEQEWRGAWRTRSSGGLGFSRTDALSALGVAALTGLAITTARPDLNPAASLASKASSSATGSTAAASSSSVATSSSVLGAKKGYLGWRRLIDVEARAKDQNKGQVTYPVRFVAYLSRFLLNFDEDDRALWSRLAREIPFTYTGERVQATRRAQFAALADSVEIGLYDFQVRGDGV